MTNKNIVFILTDDQRFDTIHALGNPDIQTPHLDELVASGISFEQAHIPGGTSGAICMPSRAMIHSSQSLFKLEDCGESIPKNHPLLGETLKRAGYQTYRIGKWHNSSDSYAHSFTDGNQIFFGGMWNHWNVPTYSYDKQGAYDDTHKFTHNPFSSNTVIELASQQIELGKHSTDLFTEETIRFLTQPVIKEQPFFMYTSFLAPHDPRTMPEKYQQMYQIEGLFDETIIIFSGDNGIAIGQHGLMGKQNLYEHSVRVPLIMAGSGLPQGEKRQQYVYLMDIFPTICELVGILPPKDLAGKSLRPIIENQESVRESHFGAFTDKIRSYKKDRYKLIEYRTQFGNYTQLFDLKDDPCESHDLSQLPSYRSLVAKLKIALKKLP